MSEVSVIFYTVKDSLHKVRAILQTVDAHMSNKETITLVVPDEKALAFTKDLLWKVPKESFRPSGNKGDLVQFAFPGDPIEAHAVFNLSSSPYAPSSFVKKVYELEDISHKEKAAAFKKKFQTYQKEGFLLAAGTVS